MDIKFRCVVNPMTKLTGVAFSKRKRIIAQVMVSRHTAKV